MGVNKSSVAVNPFPSSSPIFWEGCPYFNPLPVRWELSVVRPQTIGYGRPSGPGSLPEGRDGTSIPGVNVLCDSNRSAGNSYGGELGA